MPAHSKPKSHSGAEGVSKLPSRRRPAKHRYVLPLDAEMREKVERDRKPYPKRAGSRGIAAPPDQGGEDGEAPIPALQSKENDEGISAS